MKKSQRLKSAKSSIVVEPTAVAPEPVADGNAAADRYPQRIVCLTEEPTEVLYALGEERRIVGISGFTVRPARARREKPRV
ncbi:MAG TPA: ABC transporter substrate-binding protein, partial [Gemmatimonadaceae bacterium]